jgi:hypothetical protein
VSLLKRISRFWPLALALAVVSLASGYLLFGIGIAPLILQAHHCLHGNTDPTCAEQVQSTWHASAGPAVFMFGVVVLLFALVLVAIRFLAKGPPANQ